MISKDTNRFSIIDYEEQYALDFKNISLEWFASDFFKSHFKEDPYDYEVISNPSRHIIDKGGHIFFAKKMEGKIIGTVALIARGNNSFELSKLGILQSYRGSKVSNALMTAAIVYSKAQGKKTLWLESIRILKPALAVFKKYGFQEIPLGEDSHYTRADIKMVLKL